ncbi:tetratricopeptide repeat protein [Desulfohalovibrio reitneri]|uniref:tetratricopeptide repeat protein n=1 Tax=Desulfohalovibrio reitneri TaxID=1307759 RepID=UPI0004A6FDB9|nr:tetratricopeptide repeat protein [Desulfohalovibrio reitneri]
MRRLLRAGPFRLLAAVLAVLLFQAAPAAALDVSLSVSDSTETLTLEFDRAPPRAEVSRTAADRVTVNFPQSFWDGVQPPVTRRFGDSRLVNEVRPAPDGVLVDLKTDGFGFIRMPQQGERVVVQFFRDPIGSRWQPREDAAQAEPAPSPEPESAPAPEPEQRSEPPAQAETAPAQPAPPEPEESAEPEATAVEPAPEPSPEPAMAPAQRPEARVESPFSLRAPVRRKGPEGAPSYSTSPANGQAVSPESGLGVSESVPSPGGEPVEEAARVPGGGDPAPEGRAATTAGGSGMVMANGRPWPGEMGQGNGSVRMPITRQTLPEMLAEAESGVERAAGEAGRAVEGAAEDVGRAAEESYRDAPLAEEATEETAALEGEPAPKEAPEEPAPETAEQEKPEPDPELDRRDAMQRALAAMNGGKYRLAVTELETLLQDPGLTADMRENALFNLARARFQLYQDNLSAHYDDVTGAFERAMNADPDSPRVAEALLNLGLVNLRVGNLPEARGYFNLLRKRYPNDENIPYIDYYWGNHYYAEGDYQQAADHFQALVQNHPDSRVVRPASVKLARSLNELGYYDQAYQMVDFVDKRWPRYYVESPGFLRLSGTVANNLERYQEAKEDYWTYYNLSPGAEEMDVVLARIGDIYLREDKVEPAKEVYTRVADRYPDQQGGLIAKMRLAEEGVYDDPTTEQMFSVFDRPFTLRPSRIYSRIVEDYPKSALAPLAQLKLAMWHLFRSQPDEALAAVEGFIEKYPKNSLRARAEEVGYGAFEKSVAGASDNGNWARIVGMWERFGFLRENRDELLPDTRMAVAMAYWKRDEGRKALVLAEPFLEGEKQGKLSEMALNLALDIYLGRHNWSEVVGLAKTAKDWELPGKLRQDVSYAHALSLVNLGRLEESEGLWSKLAQDFELPPAERATALYYMAVLAGRENQLEKQFLYAQEALAGFVAENASQGKVKDLLTMLINVTERAGRMNDALNWALEYDRLVTPEDEDWAPFRIRLAGIYRDMGDREAWREVLRDVIEKKPDSIYARTARSALDTWRLEQETEQFTATGP